MHVRKQQNNKRCLFKIDGKMTIKNWREFSVTILMTADTKHIYNVYFTRKYRSLLTARVT